FPFETAREIVETELGMSLTEAYGSFEREPIAAASLGQVHRAALRDGTPVVVKVQRPDIQRRIHTDIEALSEIAQLLQDHTDIGKRYRLIDLLREFRRQISRELDYTAEAQSLNTLADNLEEYERLVVPRPFETLT